MKKPVLEVENLKTYFFTRKRVVKAVDGVSFSLSQGEALGIVGESGCGKSVTCLSILKLVPQPAGRIVGGRILFQGEDIIPKSEEEMRKLRGSCISMILQDPLTSLNPAFTIGSQVTEAIRIHQTVSKKSLRQKAIDILCQLNIPAPEARLGNYPHQMSGGMRQRVVGAMALSCQPSILIADEPTTCLDATIQAQYLRLLQQVKQETNVSLIYITHDFGIVAKMCDRVAVMYAGKIVESAGVREIFNTPRHPYTVSLLKCVPNLATKVKRLVTIDGQPPTLYNLPEGCSFAPRCPQAQKRCTQESPPLVEISPGCQVRCWLFG